ncbi:unnamed protein product [Parajaminaea phylloscopi]
MARNQEKAQSMLYRFREAQAAELGISRPRNQRRPRLASSVQDLRECERWRGEVLKEISRKVSRIQDFGLTDYEVRDLNDEINRLLREKNHWENQIIALGGANYKRGIRSMVDDAGREIPGTRGYKYFGRAKDLPGVKELLTRSVEQAEQAEEGYKASKYRRFANQPPSYLGDDDEDDGVLLPEEHEREAQMWASAIDEIAEQLGYQAEGSSGSSQNDLAALIGVPLQLPRPKAENLKVAMASSSPAQHKMDAEENGAEAEVTDETTDQGKRKKDSNRSKEADAHKKSKTEVDSEDSRLAQILPALDPSQLATPQVPDRQATEAFILRERKRMLREEYNIGGGSKAAQAP